MGLELKFPTGWVGIRVGPLLLNNYLSKHQYQKHPSQFEQHLQLTKLHPLNKQVTPQRYLYKVTFDQQPILIEPLPAYSSTRDRICVISHRYKPLGFDSRPVRVSGYPSLISLPLDMTWFLYRGFG